MKRIIIPLATFAFILALIETYYHWREERQWDALFAQPHVREAMHRMAREARQQYLVGETIEGGFEA